MNEIDFILEQLKDLTAIDSPTGFTEYAAEHVMNVYKKMATLLSALLKAESLLISAARMKMMPFC